jgi:hypothetical protein
MSSNNSNWGIFSFILFILGSLFITFLAGVFVSVFNLFPYPSLKATVNELRQALSEGPELDDYRHFLKIARYDETGVTAYVPDSVQPGVTLVSGYWKKNSKWQPAIRLIDFEGKLLHEWEVHPEIIGADSEFKERAKPTNYVHGTYLRPDGDIVFNVEYLGMVRMDACGKVKWLVPYQLHHSISTDDDGNYWAAGLEWRLEPVEEYAHLNPPFVEETLIQVSPDGEILRRISILKALYDSGYQGTFASNQKRHDLTHMNDVEYLSADIANKFPLFEAGDILVSLRTFNMVVVVDGRTEKVKWHFQHPLIHQHDPDFEPDGNIVIFDNHDNTTNDGSLWGRTQLLRVDPVTKSYARIYPTNDSQEFYTQFGGKHQLLENGNRLISEPATGRVFEVTTDGETVWNWITEERDGKFVPEVLEGARYPASFINFTEGLLCSR